MNGSRLFRGTGQRVYGILFSYKLIKNTRAFGRIILNRCKFIINKLLNWEYILKDIAWKLERIIYFIMQIASEFSFNFMR